MKKIFSNKHIWIIVATFVLGLVLMQTIENQLTTKDTLYPILGLVPSLGIIYWYIIKPIITNKQK